MVRAGFCLQRSACWRGLGKGGGGGEEGEAGRGHMLEVRQYLLLLMGRSPNGELREAQAGRSPCYDRGQQDTPARCCPGKVRRAAGQPGRGTWGAVGLGYMVCQVTSTWLRSRERAGGALGDGPGRPKIVDWGLEQSVTCGRTSPVEPGYARPGLGTGPWLVPTHLQLGLGQGSLGC